MTQISYAPGEWRAAITPQGVVLLGPGTPGALAALIWRDADRGLPAVLGALTSAFGASLDALPPFAVVRREEGATRLAVRGDVVAIVEGASSTETVSGAGVTTWTERVLPAATRIMVRTSSAGAEAAHLPVRDGVVLASEIAIAWTDASTSAVARPRAAEPDPPPASAEVETSLGSPAPTAEPAAGEQTSPEQTAPAVAEPTPPAPGSVSLAKASPAPALAAAAPSATAPPAFGIPPLPPLPRTSEDARSTQASAPAVGAELGADRGPAAPTATSRDLPVASASEEGLDPDASAYDDLWGETVARPADADVRPTHDDADPLLGDHDGETISVAELRALRASVSDSAPAPLAPPRLPAPARVRLSTGEVVMLNRTVVIGRRPRSTRVSGTDLPHLVAVESPQQDISRSHLELRVDGGGIVATDLNTTNGTLLRRAAEPPVRLHPGEATVVIAGDVLDLGDGVTVEIEELS